MKYLFVSCVYQSSFFCLATSSVDLDTDNAIQEVIRGPQLKSVTMFIIA